MRGVMFAGYAIESLGMRLAVMPHLLLPFRQSSLRGTAMVLINSLGYETYPATRTAATVCGIVIRKMRHYGEPHLLALNGEESSDPLRGLNQSPTLWVGILYQGTEYR
jgi:hypothetical protein